MLVGLPTALTAAAISDLSADALAVITELIKRAGLPAKNETGRPPEEGLWETLAPFPRQHQTPPRQLRAIADRMGFSVEAPEKRGISA